MRAYNDPLRNVPAEEGGNKYVKGGQGKSSSGIDVLWLESVRKELEGLVYRAAGVLDAGNQSQIEDAIRQIAYESAHGTSGVYSGTWRPDSGAFPSDAKEGYYYTIVADGTLDGVTFARGSELVAIVDDPSTTKFSTNWYIRKHAIMSGDDVGLLANDVGYLKAANNLNELVDKVKARANMGADDADNLLKGSITKQVHGTQPGGDLHSNATESDAGFLSPADKKKINRLSVTSGVDLDAIVTRVNALDSAVVLVGTWAPSSGAFPADSHAGYSYYVDGSGTVDGVAFVKGDRLLCLQDAAATDHYDGNWLKLDYTDAIHSVFGRTGAVTAQSGDYNADQISETANNKVLTAAERTKLAGIETGAEVNVQPDVSQTDDSQDDYIKNFPVIGSIASHDLTVSESAPTGGEDGDIWIKV